MPGKIVIQPEPVSPALVLRLEALIFHSQRITPGKLQQVMLVPRLLLVAYAQDQPLGFKFGYQRQRPDHFHSWLGGVLQEYRRRGIGLELLNEQESWARKHGFRTIGFTTFDHYPAMRALGKRAGYRVIQVSTDKGGIKYRYEKTLV